MTAFDPPCPSPVAALLSAYLDGETPPAESAAVGAHLEDCALCRGELESLRATATTLRSWARVDPVVAPPDFVGAVQSTIRQRSRGRFFRGDDDGRSGSVTSGGPTYNAVAMAMLVILASAATALLPSPRVAPPRLAEAPSASRPRRAFRVVVSASEQALRAAALNAGITDIRPAAAGRGLDVEAPREAVDRLLRALGGLGPAEVERLPAPKGAAEGDRVELRF